MTELQKDTPRYRISPITLFLAVVLTIVLALGALPTFGINHQRAEIVRNLNNARGIKSALDLFAGDFNGEYPSDNTAEELMNIEPSHPLTQTTSPPTTSNHYFNQLIGRGLDNEELFYGKNFKRAFFLKKANSDRILGQGENVWGYTKNLKTTSSLHLPLIYDSPTSSGSEPRFSKKVHDGKIVIVRIDGSTRSEKITGPDFKKGIITKKINGRQINIFSPEALEGGVCLPADLKRIGSKN